MRIDVRQRDEDVDVVAASGTLDPVTAPRLRAVLDSRLAAGRVHVLLDLRGVKIFDPTAAQMLAPVADRAAAAGGSVRTLAPAGFAGDLPGVLEWDPGLLESDVDTADPSDVEGRDVTIDALLAAAARLPEGCAERVELRRQAIEDAMPMARRLARRFRDRGEPGEDLTQVAMLGLVRAIDGYDPERGCEFASYATPTIVGELRRYFRDKGWRIRVPRRLQELRLRVNRASAELTQRRAATPTAADIAGHLGVAEAEVAEAMEAGLLYQPLSLQAPGAPDTELEIADPLGSDDPAIAVVEQRESVRPLLATLPERERAILSMRFFGEMTQSQIADRLGISQMHVSRLLSQTLGNLRAALVDAA